MRFLTINISDFHLAINAEDVVAVGKSPSPGRVHMLNLEALLGLKNRGEEGRPKVTCRRGNKVFEFKVDRILGLEELSPQDVAPWPRLLNANRLFQGVARQADRLFLILDTGAMADEAGRQRK